MNCLKRKKRICTRGMKSNVRGESKRFRSRPEYEGGEISQAEGHSGIAISRVPSSQPLCV